VFLTEPAKPVVWFPVQGVRSLLENRRPGDQALCAVARDLS
jgi:hypothetical protein